MTFESLFLLYSHNQANVHDVGILPSMIQKSGRHVIPVKLVEITIKF